MELKKFEAPTLAEALKVIKQEFGPEAVIISTKNNRSSLGLMNKSSVEVTAAVSDEAMERKQMSERRLTAEQRQALYEKPAQKVVQAYDILSGNRLKRDLTRARDAMGNGANLPRSSTSPQQKLGGATESPRPQTTQRRYIDIQDDDSPAEQMTERAQDRTRISSPSAPMPRTPAQVVAQMAQTMAAGPAPALRSTNAILPKLVAELIDAGIEPELVRSVGDELKIIMVREHISREDILRLQLARVLMSRVRVARPLGERLRIPNTPRVITFVGPTGVGKTTTIAKIAAELVIHQKRPVVLATTDTFKIAAVEQLQTYANILRIPLEVCPNADALSDIATRLGGEDVVLVDTAGYGPKDEKKLGELKEILSGIRMETHLCISATTRDRDLVDVVNRFKLFDTDYLVCTKLDETSCYGNLFNISARTHLPLSYFTMGQRVPEDMEVATKERLADLLINVTGG
jgi:flagellar biosynthesis protein FlhF